MMLHEQSAIEIAEGILANPNAYCQETIKLAQCFITQRKQFLEMCTSF